MKLKDLIDKRRRSISFKSKMGFTIDIALIHEEENNFKEAFEEYQTLLSLALEDNDLVMQAKAYRQMGECMLELQSPSKALKHIKLYLKSAKSCGDLFEIQRACVTIGRCYLDLANGFKVLKDKENSLNQSQAAFLKSLQLTQKLSQTHSENESKLESELAEMRAVSMFNLGLVNREKDTETSITLAEKYLSQCSTLSLNRKLYDLYLRSIIELIEIKYNKGLQGLLYQSNQFDVNSDLEGALKLIKSSFKQLENVPFTSNMKKLRKDIQVIEARILLVAGHVLKSAKKYRNLRFRYQSNREKNNENIILCIKLNKQLKFINDKHCTIKDNKYLGQLYEGLQVPQLAYKYYKKAMESIKDKTNKNFWKFANKLIAINTSCKYYKNNIPLLEMKLKQLLREQSKDAFNNMTTARQCCGLILKMVNCWIRSGTLVQNKDKVISFIEQMDSLSIITENQEIEIKCTKAIVDVYEQLAKENISLYTDKLCIVKEKLCRLKSLSDHVEDDEDDLSQDEEFNYLNSSDNYNDSELSSLEHDESEFDVDNLSSDSDFDYNVLTSSQIEEMEALGKRVSSNKNKSIIKRNEKGETMLHVAAIRGSVKQVEHLINQMHHPVDICDTAGWTPLHDAANHGHTKVVQALLDHGANLEHTGSHVDRSTPLMEAVNGGSIDTALLLIERGADLWHKNSLGENIGDCIDGWRQRCKDNDSFHEPEARAYKNLTTTIRNKLASRYVEWCRQRKGSATFVTKPLPMQNRYTNTKDCRRTIEMEEESEENISETENDPVLNYCNTITNLGSRIISKDNKKDDKINTIGDAGYVIGDDWLENDMANNKKHVITEPDYGTFSGFSNKKKRKVYENKFENIKSSNKRIRRDSEKIDDLSTVNTSFESEDLFPTQTSMEDMRSRVSTVTVVYRNISMVVPLIEKCSVQWLMDEVVRRYSYLVPNDLMKKNNMLHISREDGAILMPTDILLTALGDINQNIVKLFVVDVDMSFDPPEIALDSQLLIHDHFATLFSSMKSTLLLGSLDVSGKNLSTNFLEFLASLKYTQNLQNLKKINFSGNQITDEMLNESFTNSHGVVTLAQFIAQYSMSLEELDLSENQFSGAALSDFLHALRSVGLPQLKVLNLSHNPIGSNDFFVMSLIMKPILMSCPMIEKLILSSCNISNLLELNNTRTFNPDSHFITTNLNFLDLSNNPCSLSRECIDIMFWKHVQHSLEHLSLRGCGSLIATTDCIFLGGQKNDRLMEMMTTIVDLINNKLSRVQTLDIGNCAQNSETICYLNRLFTNKNCSLTTLFCDANESLSQSTSGWVGLVHNLSQPLCSITHLVIDMPRIESYEDFVTVIDSIQRKVQMRIGRPLTCLDISATCQTIDFIKDAILKHEDKRLTDEDVQKIVEEYDYEELIIQFSICFVFYVLYFMRDRYMKENVKILFEGNMIKLKCLK